MDNIYIPVTSFGIGLAVGILAGWLVTRQAYAGKLAREQSSLASLSEALRGKETESSALRRDLNQARQELQTLNSKFFELSNAHASAMTTISHMESLKKNLDGNAEEIRALNFQISDYRKHLAELETRIESERKAAEEKIALFDDMKTRMMDAFKSLSTRVMQENNQSFMDLAGQTFSKYMETARQDLEAREKAVKESVRPVSEALEKYDQQVKVMENVRQKAYGALSQQVASLAQTQNELQRETGKLVNALRMPHVRGRWGEITLRRVVELSGMQNRCDFFEQQTSQAQDSMARPDMIICLPGDRKIVVDSKVPITAYLDAVSAGTPEQTEDMLERHAKHVQAHVNNLAKKEYWTQFTPTPEFVVLFMPGENFFSAALAKNPGLIEEAANKGVILATPTTLISLLKAVAYGWKQEAAAENAKAVGELGNELYNRLSSMADHINSLGRDLNKCVESYNKAVGSLEHRVLPAARKFQDMGVVVKGGKTITELAPLDNKTRTMEPQDDTP
jgi:DNA recombination protein RmuC